MWFSLVQTAERSLRRLRLTQMLALIGAVLGLPLILLLFWQGVQFQTWGQQEARAVRRVQRVAAFTRLLHQLACRGDFGLEPCPEALWENPAALQKLDDHIHQSLVELEVDDWDREIVPNHQHPEARLFLTALRGLPSRPADVAPQVWREQHQRTLDRLVNLIASAAPVDKLEYEVDHAGTPVEWYVAHVLPSLVARLSTVTDFGMAAAAAVTPEKQRRELLVNLGRARQAEAEATQMLVRLETGNPHLVGPAGSVLMSRLQDFSHTLDRIQARGFSDEPDAGQNVEAIWRNSLETRQSIEQAALLCVSNLQQQHQHARAFWEWLSLGIFGATLISGAAAWAGILWLQTTMQRSLARLQEISRVSPTVENAVSSVSLDGLDEELGEIGRNFLRAVAVIQTSNSFAQEAARRATLAELAAKRSEEQYTLMASATNEGLWDWDIRTDHVHHSSQVWKLLGYRPEHTPKPSFTGFLDLVHPDDRAAMMETLHAHLEHRAPFNSTFRLKNLEGEFRWFHATGQAKWDVSGRPIRMAGSLCDVTEIHQLEVDRQRFVDDLCSSHDQISAQADLLRQQTEELKEAHKRAEDASRAKGEFLANMSHELRTPLTAILGYSDLLYEEGDLAKAPRSRLEMIDTIRTNGTHLLQLIDDILDLSKIEAGRMTIESMPCHPALILDEARRLMELRAKSKGLHFEVRAVGPLPTVFHSDPARLRQILVNLLGNALKFTDTGHVTLEMSATRGTRAELTFVVRDTGIGMTAEQIGRLFQPFGQADASTTRKFGGTGLGLSISRRLAHLLNGDLSVISEPGRGSTFTARIRVEVPLHAEWQILETESLARLAGEHSPPVMTKSVLEGARILVVDDVEPNRRLIGFTLSKAKAEVVYAEQGQDAIAKIAIAEKEDRPFDIVLMDMQMPVLDGYAATRQLRGDGYRGPIIAMTAEAMVQDRQECLDAGCDDYLSKPIDRHHLLEVCTHFRFAVRTVPATAR